MTALSTRSLQPYLPRLALDWERDASGALVREIEGSMVFVDVSGFTKMSERLARQGKVGAEEVADVIGDTFGALLGEAYAYGGSLLKFGGDALLLFFAGQDHTLGATAAANGMRAELRRIGTFETTAGKVTLRMSVGAHTGLFHFFLVGESHRELIVAGAAATETVRMEGAASAGQILLSPALAAALPARNRGRALGPGILLRGASPEIELEAWDVAFADFDLEGFIPTALRSTLLEGESEPEHRTVTVGFIHYSEFDRLVAGAGPDRAAQALDDLVRSVQEAVDRHEVAFLGTDIAPDGGKIILTAGAPRVTGNDEEAMLLALRDAVAGKQVLPLEIGVNRGPVFAGEIGPPYRRTYTVMGDAVNLAARLMAKAEHGQILATPEVLGGSRTLFETTELEPFLVKGKRKPVQAFAVGEAKGSRASISEAGLPLVGRDAELAQLLAAWAEARNGRGRLVEVSADPGMGKSRLLEELVSGLGDVDVLESECRLYQSATPYFPFRSLLGRALGLEGLGPEPAASALRILVAEKAPELLPWLSLIGTPLDLDLELSPQVAELQEEFRKSRLEEAVVALLTAVVTTPTVVLVEDTHWMDEPSRDLLARLADALPRQPWLFVLSRRPGSDGYVAAEGHESVVRINLQPLGAEQAAALIETATHDSPILPHQVRALAERAEGNPLFLIELLDALRRGEDVEALPHSVEGLIQARIDLLSPGERRRLRELSVLGGGFRSEHAGAVLSDAGGTPVTRTLAALGDFLAVDRNGWVQFRHALIRDAAYEGLPYRARRMLHARVGDSILAAAGVDAEDQAELLSLHYFYAGRWAEAWGYSRVAGDRAREVYANLEAGRFYERAISAAARLDGLDPHTQVGVAARLCEVRERAGLFDDALDALRRARKHAGDPVELADLHVRRARVLIRMGSLRTAYRETTRGFRLVESSLGVEAAKERARLIGLSATIRLTEGRPEEARVLAERAIAEAEGSDEPSVLARAYAVLDDAYVDLGQAEEAVYAQRAIELYEQLGDLPGVGSVEVSMGVRAYAEGRWDDALESYGRAQDAYRRSGDETHAANAAGNVGEILVSRGRFDDAEPILLQTARILRAHGAVPPAVFAEIQVGRLHLGRGELAEAVSTLTHAHEEAIAVGNPFLALESGVHLAAALARDGAAERSLQILDEELERGGSLADYFGASLARSRGEALVALGRLDEAGSAVEKGLERARELGAPYEEAQLLLLRAEIRQRTGADMDAEALQESARLLQRLGVRS